MRSITVDDARSPLSELLDQVAAGEEILIERAGKPVAKLVPYGEGDRPREPGYWSGKVWIADDFDELPEMLAGPFAKPAK